VTSRVNGPAVAVSDGRKGGVLDRRAVTDAQRSARRDQARYSWLGGGVAVVVVVVVNVMRW
jgi:hypothetical protein